MLVVATRKSITSRCVGLIISHSMIRKKKVYEGYFQKHNRIFYIAVDKENIYLLHACHKQKNKTERKDTKLVRKRASELGGQLGKKFI